LDLVGSGHQNAGVLGFVAKPEQGQERSQSSGQAHAASMSNGCVANFEQGHEDGRRSVTGSGSKQIELLSQ
jgi:hypothetical protein